LSYRIYLFTDILTLWCEFPHRFLVDKALISLFFAFVQGIDDADHK
jgi:hypothetical protein